MDQTIWNTSKVAVLFLGLFASACRELPANANTNHMHAIQGFTGMCDASGVVALDADHFVVANDEDNLLRVYDFRKGGPVAATFDLNPFLKLKPKDEADLEGAARLGDEIYWITSHGRNKNGEERPARHQFFATRISYRNNDLKVEGVGKSYTSLVQDLLVHPDLAPYDLASAARLAPKAKGGLNIEGLCATAEGHLLIGFRNPIPKSKALLVPLLNPAKVVQGQKADLGRPVLLDLGGYGIRDILYTGGKFLLLAGAFDSNDASHLYEWDGKGAPRLLMEIKRERGNPEALLPAEHNATSSIRILLDNGSTLIDGKACKDVKDPNRKFFEVIALNLPAPP